MNKKTVAILFGGASSEHEVSQWSAASIIDNIAKDKYDIFLIGITKRGQWFLYDGDVSKISTGDWEHDDAHKKPAIISPDAGVKGLLVLDGYTYRVVQLDVVIPMLHGKNGEDGTVQGLLQLAGIPFVGCGTYSSAACMDKITTNIILTSAGIKKARFAFITGTDFADNPEAAISHIESSLKGYPVFVKPSNAGSAVGVNKANNREELSRAIKVALHEDNRILVEEAIVGQEVECAVLGNEHPIASTVGEIAPANEFYDYEAKYANENSKLYIPARISSQTIDKLREIALHAYKLMDCRGLARVDFFVQSGTGQMFLNEINTIPGFTSISMYPKLLEEIGIPYPELIDRLINFALERPAADE